MRKFFSRVFVLASMLAMAACGGGGDDSKFETPGAGGGGGVTVSTMTLSSTATSIPGDGSSTATISALAKDANNNAIKGVPVTFSVNGGNLVVTQGATDDSGVAKATLSASGMAAGSTLTVTASGGGTSANISVAVANTQQTVTVVTDLPQMASDNSKAATITAIVRGANNQLLPNVAVDFSSTSGGLGVTSAVTDAKGQATATLNTAGDPTNRHITVTAAAGATSATVGVDIVGTKLTVAGPTRLVQGSTGTYNVSLSDSSNNAITGRAVTVASAKANTVTPATGLATDASGHGTFSLKAINSGNDTVTLTALGMTAVQTIAVSNENFAVTAPAADTKIALNTPTNVTVTWLTGAAPQANKQITFSTTRGLFGASVSTTATTDAAGKATVQIASTTAGPAIITATSTGVSAQIEVDFIATTPSTLSLQASPTTIPIQGASTISAVVRDPTQNLVEGQTVNFQLTDITGGSLSLASAVTDVQGRAQTVYTASNTPSSAGGVTITANVQGTALTPATASLTVGGQTVFIKLVTGTKLAENGTFTQFIMPYTVMAIDSAGNPVNGVTIVLTAHSTLYRKGSWIKGVSSWTFPIVPNCANEDLDLDGVFNATIDADANHNGTLEPGDVAAATPGSVVTSVNGSADFSVVYGQNFAQWVQIQLTAKATVQGTESSTSATISLPMLAKYVNDVSADIPGLNSPYGTGACSSPN
jgi:hypothetical protein